jgi:hypothetical protein
MNKESIENADERWHESFELTIQLLNEAGVHWKTV